MTLKAKKKTDEENIVVENECVGTERLQLATDLVSGKFNLDPSYSVKKFEDKGKVVNLALENADFIVSVSIKDSEMQGLFVE